MEIKATAYDVNGNEILCPTCKKNGPGSILQGVDAFMTTPCSECEPPKETARLVYRPSLDTEPKQKLGIQFFNLEWDEKSENWISSIEEI